MPRASQTRACPHWVVPSRGSAGSFSGAFSLTPALAARINVDLSARVSVEINNLAVAVKQTLVIGVTELVLDLPKGPYLRIAADDVAITVAGVTFTADLAIDRFGPLGKRVTRIAIANGSILPSGGAPAAGGSSRRDDAPDSPGGAPRGGPRR